MISEKFYLDSQEKIKNSKAYRNFVVFWAFYSIFIVFLSGVYFLIAGQYKIIIIALAAFVFARLVVSPLIYVFYKKQRPYQLLNFKPLSSLLFSLETKRPNAFPSDHALSFASIATVLFSASPPIGALIFLFGAINSWARIALGDHDFIDILAGWLIGTASGLLALYLGLRFW